MAYLPKSKYDLIVNDIKDQVAQIDAKTEKKSYVSQLDAIISWITRQIALTESKPRPVTILSLVNCRFCLKQLRNTDDVHLQNMLLMTYTHLSAVDARGLLAPMALSHRAQTAEQTTELRAISYMQWIAARIENNNHTIPICAQDNANLIFFNSIAKANIITGTDFGPAVVQPGEDTETRANPPGTMINSISRDANDSVPFLNAVTVFGTDHEDGTWLYGYLPLKVWDAVEHQLKPELAKQ